MDAYRTLRWSTGKALEDGFAYKMLAIQATSKIGVLRASRPFRDHCITSVTEMYHISKHEILKLTKCKFV